MKKTALIATLAALSAIAALAQQTGQTTGANQTVTESSPSVYDNTGDRHFWNEPFDNGTGAYVVNGSSVQGPNSLPDNSPMNSTLQNLVNDVQNITNGRQ
jgi:hypothetical protein